MCDLMECSECRKYKPMDKIKCEEVKELWSEFGDISMNPETEEIEEEWLSFPAGTHREVIWYWFEKRFNISITDLMY